MSASDWTYLAGLAVSQFQSGGHRTYLVPAFNAVGQTGRDVADMAAQCLAYQTAAAGSLATQVALGLAANGVGNEPMDLPRMSMLNGEAFRQWDQAAALVVNTQDATYQITEHDGGKLLLCTSGTRTWTLPAATDVWVGWQCRLRNRSGNNLTLARAGSETINGTAASLTVATGSAILTVVCTGSTSFEVA